MRWTIISSQKQKLKCMLMHVDPQFTAISFYMVIQDQVRSFSAFKVVKLFICNATVTSVTSV